MSSAACAPPPLCPSCTPRKESPSTQVTPDERVATCSRLLWVGRCQGANRACCFRVHSKEEVNRLRKISAKGKATDEELAKRLADLRSRVSDMSADGGMLPETGSAAFRCICCDRTLPTTNTWKKPKEPLSAMAAHPFNKPVSHHHTHGSSPVVLRAGFPMVNRNVPPQERADDTAENLLRLFGKNLRPTSTSQLGNRSLSLSRSGTRSVSPSRDRSRGQPGQLPTLKNEEKGVSATPRAVTAASGLRTPKGSSRGDAGYTTLSPSGRRPLSPSHKTLGTITSLYSPGKAITQNGAMVFHGHSAPFFPGASPPARPRGGLAHSPGFTTYGNAMRPHTAPLDPLTAPPNADRT